MARTEHERPSRVRASEDECGLDQLTEGDLEDERRQLDMPHGLAARPFQAPGVGTETVGNPNAALLSREDVRADVAAILWSMKLHSVRRYFRQRHWEKETADAEYADRVERSPRLETVSEHSWHLADLLLLVAPHFGDVNVARCVEMAILHDKLELFTGDVSPIGRDGTGLKSHAFNPSARARKDENEVASLERYLRKLRPALRAHQRALLEELHLAKTQEARILKAADKMQTLAFVHWKKDGHLTDPHLQFTIRYASRCLAYFPRIQQHYSTLLHVFLNRVAKRRNTSIETIYQDFVMDSQPTLFD